jgi:D-alanyl-lipoteichoic acid acyltransferase DltB (MBOAT superfamily)
MLFPTLGFAIFFLLVFCGHWLLLPRLWLWKFFILGVSWFFYAYWDWRFLSLLILYTVVNHRLALASFRSGSPPQKRWVVLAIIFNLGLLGFFKYYGFFTMSMYALCAKLGVTCSLPLLDIVLPIGISFFTFQAMSYTIDVHRRVIEPAHNLIDFAIYKAFFPQLVAGPIIRAHHYLPQFYRISSVKHVDVGRAAVLILGGLFKKIVIANFLAAKLADPVFANPAAFHGPDVLLGVYGYALQIYCDFSAYSDIAIGVALLLGFDFPENFNAPYFATSLQDFWRRWHISLSTWLRDYLYIPLGGSRSSAAHTYVNLFITFLLGGLWHGASWAFVAWGALHGGYLALERIVIALGKRLGVPKAPVPGVVTRFFQRVLIIHFVCLTWFFFRAQGFDDAALLIKNIFSGWGACQLFTPVIALALVVGFCTQFMDGVRLTPLWNAYNRLPVVWQGLAAAVVLTIILALGPEGVAPFIYFQF